MNNQYYEYPENLPAVPAMANGNSDITSEIFGDVDRVEVIIKFSGDIYKIADEFQADVEVLLKNYAIITIAPDRINELYALPQIEGIELPKRLFLQSLFNLTSTCVRSVQDPSGRGLTGKGVIVAIIDYGIDYTHQDFRNADGTSRILYLWDQTEIGTPPEGFKAGAEYTQEQINAALRSEDPYAIVPSRDISGHGSAVAGIAAGNGRESNGVNTGVAPEANLIIVKVGTRGFTSFARTTEIMRALKYVIEKARDLNQPLAVNLSFGMNNGAHRGDSIFETYISDVSPIWKNVIVISTGNEGAVGHHYSTKLTSNTTHEIGFFTASGINELFLTLWKDFVDSFTVEMIFPDGSSSGIIGIENQFKSVRMGNVVLSVLYGQPSYYSVRQEIFFNIRAVTGVITAGVWKLRIITATVVNGNIDIWLPTIEEVSLNTQFTNPTANMTLTIPSTAGKVIKVAGYNDRIGNLAEFSGVGSITEAPPKPDLAAPAVDILTVKNGGGYDSYSGTSMAAPFVTGSSALIMQWGIVQRNAPFLYGERVKAFLRLGANRKGNELYPQAGIGYGTLCLSSTMNFLERYKWGGNTQWLQT